MVDSWCNALPVLAVNLFGIWYLIAIDTYLIGNNGLFLLMFCRYGVG